MHTIAHSPKVNATMSSRMIAELVDKRHHHVARDVRNMLQRLGEDETKFGSTYLDASNREKTEYHLPRRECEILITGYDVKRRAAVIDRWMDLETALRAPVKATLPSGEAMDFVKLALEQLPNLGDNTKQTLLSYASLSAFGERLIPLPRVEEHLMSATEVGQQIGVSANKVGRLANANGLKRDGFGEYRMDKSRHSSKTVENFYYNSAAVAQFKNLTA